MSKAIMLSIQPKWCELIASGRKTIEVRKNRPQIEVPFKCYIYETKGKSADMLMRKDSSGESVFTYNNGKGKVIGEFVCDEVNHFLDNFNVWVLARHAMGFEKEEELWEYNPDDKMLYGWHISNLKIYDKPKELGEFKRQNTCYKEGSIDEIGCWEKCCVRQELGECDGQFSSITRPPQSWAYVEED